MHYLNLYIQSNHKWLIYVHTQSHTRTHTHTHTNTHTHTRSLPNLILRIYRKIKSWRRGEKVSYCKREKRRRVEKEREKNARVTENNLPLCINQWEGENWRKINQWQRGSYKEEIVETFHLCACVCVCVCVYLTSENVCTCEFVWCVF